MARKCGLGEGRARREACRPLRGASHGAWHTARAHEPPAGSRTHALTHSFSRHIRQCQAPGTQGEHTRQAPQAEVGRDNKTMDKQMRQCRAGRDRPTGRAKRSLFGAFILRPGARCVSSRPLSADGPRRPLCQPSVGEREAAVPRTRIGASPLTRTAGGPWPGGSRLPSLTPDSLTGRYPCLVLWPQNSYIKKINRVQFDLLYFVTEGDGVAGIAPCSCAGPFHGC